MRRRISITAIRRRRTIVLTRDAELPGDSKPLEPLSPDPTTNNIEKRRNDHEYKDETSDDTYSRNVDIWFVGSTDDLSTIRERIIGCTRKLRESGSDAVDE